MRGKLWFMLRLLIYTYFSIALIGHTGDKWLASLGLLSAILGDFILFKESPTNTKDAK